jgi:hypothetical protein
MVRIIEGLTEDWRRVDQRIDELSSEIEDLAKRDPACVRLMRVPGVGSIISSAMVAAIGTGEGFSKGRDFAAWLGLVPQQISTLFERENTLPVILHADHNPAVLLCLIIQCLCEGADLRVGKSLCRTISVFTLGIVVQHQHH